MSSINLKLNFSVSQQQMKKSVEEINLFSENFNKNSIPDQVNVIFLQIFCSSFINSIKTLLFNDDFSRQIFDFLA